MEIYWSWKTIILYIVIAYILTFLFGKTVKLKAKKDKSRYVYYFLAYLIMIIFACTRTIGQKIGGTDSLNYISFFENSLQPVKFDLLLTLTFKGDEYIFYTILYLVRMISGDYHVMFFVVYSIIILAYIFFVEKEITKDSTVPMLMLIILSFLMSFNILRNCLACAVSLIAIHYLRKNKMIPFFIFAICAFLMHYTASIIILFYLFNLFMKDKYFKNKRTVFSFTIFISVILVVLYPIILDIFYKSGYTTYLEQEYSLIGHIPKAILMIILYLLYDDIVKNLSEQNKMIYLKLFMFFIMILPISILVGGVTRLVLFFDFAIIILWGEIIDVLRNKIKYGDKKLRSEVMIIAYILITLWIVFRIYRIGFTHGIMPYYSDLF